MYENRNRLRSEEPKDPTNDNVFALYKVFANEEEQAEMAENYVKVATDTAMLNKHSMRNGCLFRPFRV